MGQLRRDRYQLESEKKKRTQRPAHALTSQRLNVALTASTRQT